MAKRKGELAGKLGWQQQITPQQPVEDDEPEVEEAGTEEAEGEREKKKKSTRSVGTYDIPPELKTWVRQIAKDESVSQGDIVSTAIMMLREALDRGIIDLEQYKVHTRHLKFDFRIVFPMDFNFFDD